MTEEAQNNVEFSQDDLSLVGQVADEGKDKSDIWKEIQAEKHGATDEADASDQDAAASSQDDENNGTPAAEDAAGEEEAGQGAATAAATENADEAADKAADGKSGSEGDIWANATPEQREAFQALEKRLKSDDGRVAAYQRQVRDLQRQLSAPPKTGRTGTDKHGDLKGAIDQIKSMEEDFPEIAGPLKSVMEAVNSRFEDMQAVEERRHRAAQKSTADSIDYETQRLDQMLPGWEQFKSDNEEAYVAWVNDGNTPAWVRPAVLRHVDGIVDADEAFRVMQLFQEHMNPGAATGSEEGPDPASEQNGKLKTKRELQRRSTNGPRTTSGAPVATGIPEDGDKKAIWKAIQQEKARARADEQRLYP